MVLNELVNYWQLIVINLQLSNSSQLKILFNIYISPILLIDTILFDLIMQSE